MKLRASLLAITLTLLAASSSVSAALPDPGMTIDPERTAVLITDPQNDFLSPDGVAWGVVGKSVTKNNTVANIESLFKAAKANDMPVFVSPHYYYPTDHGWKFEGALERLMHTIGMFDRKGALTTEGFEGSGADWLESYKPYINDGKPSFPTRIKFTGRKPMTWCCNCVNVVSTRSFLAGCRPTSVPSHICVN